MVNSKSPILLHDNANLHVARETLEKIKLVEVWKAVSSTDYHSFQAFDHLLTGKLLSNKVNRKYVFQESSSLVLRTFIKPEFKKLFHVGKGVLNQREITLVK